jgi:hypothetical protein
MGDKVTLGFDGKLAVLLQAPRFIKYFRPVELRQLLESSINDFQSSLSLDQEPLMTVVDK